MDIMQWTVNEALKRVPDSVAILNHFGVDTCCGGNLTLALAASSIGLSLEDLRAALEPALKEKS